MSDLTDNPPEWLVDLFYEKMQDMDPVYVKPRTYQNPHPPRIKEWGCGVRRDGCIADYNDRMEARAYHNKDEWTVVGCTVDLPVTRKKIRENLR